ncbi:MAG: hypothetical protein ACREOG_11865 [Gemmatimonadaceae bacterium]
MKRRRGLSWKSADLDAYYRYLTEEDGMGSIMVLIDELHVCMYPLTRGSGPRLFVDGAAGSKWSLAASESYGNGVLYLHYRTT